MAKLPGSGTRIYIDEFHFSAVIKSGGLEISQATPVVTCLSDGGPRRVVDNYDHSGGDMGFFEPTDDDYDERMFARIGSASDILRTVLPGASAEGGPNYDQAVAVAREPRSWKTGDAVLLDVEWVGRGAMSRGLILANATVTGAGNRTGRNQGVKASGVTYRAIFRLISFSGTDITLKIQESSDDGSGDAYADVGGLTSGALTAAGIVAATTTAAMEAWRRVNISGTFSNAVILVTAGNLS